MEILVLILFYSQDCFVQSEGSNAIRDTKVQHSGKTSRNCPATKKYKIGESSEGVGSSHAMYNEDSE